LYSNIKQYVHDAFCHIEEDILVNGPLDRNDDSILEKGNRRKKRLGDRCTFRGGKNGNPASGRATFTQVRRVKVRDANGTFTGNYLRKTITRLANIGVAAQVLKLDLIAQLDAQVSERKVRLEVTDAARAWMAKEGYVFTHATTKRRHWRRGAQTLSSKTTPDFTERLGPNNGFMRVFFHDVATKLRAFHPGYGWDEGLVAALYRAGGQEMTLVHRAYEKNWTEEESPRGWVLALIATYDSVWTEEESPRGWVLAMIATNDSVCTRDCRAGAPTNALPRHLHERHRERPRSKLRDRRRRTKDGNPGGLGRGLAW
jgi:hypothetical protein